MGTITCLINETKTLTVTAIAGADPQNTWARFHHAVFQVSGGSTFNLVLTVPNASFRFDTQDPIDWGTSGQPSWIQVPPGPLSATGITLQIDSTEVGSIEFLVRNSEGEPITLTIDSAGGSGGTGGTISSYIGDDETALIGQLPPGATVSGDNLHFGFKDAGMNQLFLSPAGTLVIHGFNWSGSQPADIAVDELSSQITFSITNVVGNPPVREEASFTIQTGDGTIDPTIITNPDESAP